jgi:TonB family protein
MGKIVKYCAACDESFAEKFAFCPNCGQAMSAFEMNPLTGAETKVSDAPVAGVESAKAVESEIKSDVPIAAPPVSAESSANFKTPETAKTREFFTVNPIEPTVAKTADETAAIGDSAIKEDLEPETKTFAAAAAGTNGSTSDFQTTASDDHQSNFNAPTVKKQPVGAYNITVIEEKNVGRRNGLLLATMIFMVSLVLGATIFSLFNRDLLVGAIDEDSPLYVSVIDDVPMEIEEQPKPKNDKDAGGGGGGGKDEPEPASKGRLVSQSDKPITPPDAKSVQLTNPDIKLVYETKGTIKRPVTAERPGLPGSDNLNPSNGTGRGGGIGGGNGTGIGGGNGTGEGNGNGSGSGNGNGNGIGNGRGDGTQGIPKAPPPPPPVAVGPTEGVKIISRPKPPYTDSARQNQVTGTVRLRVTFSANGQIGSISPVSGLPYGLTEQAIAAAKQIRFEPAKKNGVPVPSTRVIEYSFSIY